jgi:hypothetical protein
MEEDSCDQTFQGQTKERCSVDVGFRSAGTHVTGQQWRRLGMNQSAEGNSKTCFDVSPGIDNQTWNEGHSTGDANQTFV